MGEVVRAFTTEEAERLTGLSRRRLQYWDETDFIRPSVAARQGRGSPRLYSFRDLVELRVAAMLRNHLPLQVLRKLGAALDVDAPFATLKFGISASGEVVYLGADGLPEAVRQPGQIVATYDVPLAEIRADLSGAIERLRKRRSVGAVKTARGVLGGRAVMVGTRIPPETVARLVAAGWPRSRILREYPELRAPDIDAALEYVRSA